MSLSFQCLFYILHTNPSLVILLTNIFLPMCSMSFHSFTMILHKAKVFIFYEIYQFLCVMCHPYGIISNSLPDPMSQMFPHKCFIVLPLYLGLWSISNLFLHKVWGIDPTPFTEKTIFSPFNHLAPLSKFSWPYSSGFISRLTILFQSSMCLSFC